MMETIKEVFSKKKYVAIFAVSMFIVASLFIVVPLILSNKVLSPKTLELQINIMTFFDYLIMLIVSFLTALLISMQFYLTEKYKLSVPQLLLGSAGSLTSIILGSAVCLPCILMPLSFVSLSAALFIARYRNEILILAILLLIFSIKTTADKIKGTCTTCK